ncbi:hypothetical protein BBF96_10585 [Anoxybacter fermentans]|uniref:Uncharacterized protein n=1 Tax=Anoxybacter fermentans TaxID=1323375 RepID=A0A3S9SZL3_9FIRM|nr:hypothetical protein [Anoxybacter fermentans]AZR73793.1 hypothetical protein BBF96_10585 [Anoxybacter fermentans]
MKDEQDFLKQQYKEAIRTVEEISKERKLKGNANVTAGRYGELVANMIKYAESKMALEMMEKRKLPTHKHLELESLRGQNVINPT